MSTITKQWLQQTIAEYEANRDELPFGLDTNSAIELQAFKLALASLEAEAVAYMWDSDRNDVDAAGYYRPEHKIFAESSVKRYGGKVVTLYAAPQPLTDAERAELQEYRKAQTADREMLKRLAVILSGSDAPGEIKALTVTAQSFVDRCKFLSKERDVLRNTAIIAAAPQQEVKS